MRHVNPMYVNSMEESKRMTILRAILQKALDASVQKASIIDVASPELESHGVQVLQTIRHGIEAEFEVLCGRYELNDKFNKLENLLEWQDQSKLGHDVGLTAALDAKASVIAPQEVFQRERIRLMLQEKTRLQEQLQQIEESNKILEDIVHKTQSEGKRMLAEIESNLKPLGGV